MQPNIPAAGASVHTEGEETQGSERPQGANVRPSVSCSSWSHTSEVDPRLQMSDECIDGGVNGSGEW